MDQEEANRNHQIENVQNEQIEQMPGTKNDLLFIIEIKNGFVDSLKQKECQICLK